MSRYQDTWDRRRGITTFKTKTYDLVLICTFRPFLIMEIITILTQPFTSDLTTSFTPKGDEMGPNLES